MPEEVAHPAPTVDNMAASARKARRMVRPVAPRALSSPISAVRWVTATSITFITRMPATARLMAAMPATPRGEGAEQLVEGGQHGVLGDDGDVLSPWCRVLGCWSSRSWPLWRDRLPALGFHQDAEEGV